VKHWENFPSVFGEHLTSVHNKYFFVGKFLHHCNQKIYIQCHMVQKIFQEKLHKVTKFWGFNFFLCHILIVGSSKLANYKEDSWSFVFSSLTCSQIWLIPLVDDCQCDYITKLNQNKIKSIIVHIPPRKEEISYTYSLRMNGVPPTFKE